MVSILSEKPRPLVKNLVAKFGYDIEVLPSDGSPLTAHMVLD
jgi:hypothetical protein